MGTTTSCAWPSIISDFGNRYTGHGPTETRQPGAQRDGRTRHWRIDCQQRNQIPDNPEWRSIHIGDHST
jgi:hypothetical protein